MRLTCKSWASRLQLPYIDASTDFDKPISSIYRILPSASDDIGCLMENKIMPVANFVTELHLSSGQVYKYDYGIWSQYLSSSSASLKKLSFHQVDWVERLFPLLQLATGIESLKITLIYSTMYDEILPLVPDLTKMTNLRSLHFEHSTWTLIKPDDMRRMLFSAPNLTSLTIGFSEDEWLTGIEHLTNLTHLNVSPTRSCANLIPKLPRLKYLNISTSRMPLERSLVIFPAVQAHPSLQELHVAFTFTGDMEISETSLPVLEMIKKNTTLTSLHLGFERGPCPLFRGLPDALKENRSLTSISFDIDENTMPSLTALLASSECRLFDLRLFNISDNPVSVNSLVKMIESINIHRQIQLKADLWKFEPLKRTEQFAQLIEAAERVGCVLLTFIDS
jgi:hypothetical protein